MSTLEQIRDNVRRNIGDTRKRFWTDDGLLNQFIGQAYQFITNKIIQEGDGYFETSAYLDLVSGTASVSLASLNPTFLKIRLLSRVYTDGSTKPLERNEMRNLMSFKQAVTGNGYEPSYRLQSRNIILSPPPAANETGSATSGLKLDYYYLPDFPNYDSDDSFEFDANFPTLFEPFIELYATVSCMEQKNTTGGLSDIESFRERRDEYYQMILDSLYRDDNIEAVTQKGNNYSRPW